MLTKENQVAEQCADSKATSFSFQKISLDLYNSNQFLNKSLFPDAMKNCVHNELKRPQCLIQTLAIRLKLSADGAFDVTRFLILITYLALLKCVLRRGSDLALPVGFTASGSSMMAEGPNRML